MDMTRTHAHTQKMQCGHFLVHVEVRQLLSDTCHIGTEEVRYMSVCTYTHVCVCVCTREAVLIKLMDSVHSSTSPVRYFSLPLSLPPFALCSLPLNQSIHSGRKDFFPTSQEKSIMGQRGEEPGRAAGGGRGTGEKERIKDKWRERKRFVFCIMHQKKKKNKKTRGGGGCS